MGKENDYTVSDKINDFFVQNRKKLLFVFAVILIAVTALIVTVVVSDQKRKTAISDIEVLMTDFEKFKSEKLKNAPDSYTDEEKKLLADEEAKLIESLTKYTEQNNYAGFMAAQEIGDIYYKNADYEKALAVYEKVILGENKYTSGVLFFNAASCADELAQNEKAIELYTKASNCKDFPFKARALFNAARVQESLDKDKASEAYAKVIETYPDTEWASLSKTRIIQLGLN